MPFIRETPEVVPEKQILEDNLIEFHHYNSSGVITMVYESGYRSTNNDFVRVGEPYQKSYSGQALIDLLQRHPQLYADMKTMVYEENALAKGITGTVV